MQAWLDSMAPGYGTALMWTLAALIGLLILLVVIRIVRGLTFGTFVAGGRNRKARLAVMDATAVDSHRRLVLVRRDDVEHLILIGGPSDVVVEQNIRLMPPARRPADDPQPEPARVPQPEPVARPAAPVHAPAPTAQPVRQPAAAAPRPAPAPQAPPAHSPQREPHFSPPLHATPPAPPRPAAQPVQAAGVQTLRPVTVEPAVQPVKAGLDDAMLEELEVTLERQERQAPAPQPPSATERSLDEEMSRLLSDLSGPKR